MCVCVCVCVVSSSPEVLVRVLVRNFHPYVLSYHCGCYVSGIQDILCDTFLHAFFGLTWFFSHAFCSSGKSFYHKKVSYIILSLCHSVVSLAGTVFFLFVLNYYRNVCLTDMYPIPILIFMCPESRKTYIVIRSMVSFFFDRAETFLGTFQTSRSEKQQ